MFIAIRNPNRTPKEVTTGKQTLNVWLWTQLGQVDMGSEKTYPTAWWLVVIFPIDITILGV